MVGFLLDTNVLLRSADTASPNSQPAVEAVSALLARGDDVFLTAQNVVEFWAVATRPLSANGLGWTIERARAEVDALLDRFPILEETPAVFREWLRLVTSRAVSGKQVHDTRLVAVMTAHGVDHLLTFNVDDFKRHPDIVVVHPNELALS